MAQTQRPSPVPPNFPERVRRVELVRPVRDRKQFTSRAAQRALQLKERSWVPLAYAVFVVAALVIFATTYTTYAFSEYRGVILPGVYVDRTPLSGLDPTTADRVITSRLAAIYGVPISLTYGPWHWNPKKSDIGLRYDINGTVERAMSVGRNGSFLGQLIDRLPLHPVHEVPLIYSIRARALRAYLLKIARDPRVHHAPVNAGLQIVNNHVGVVPSQPGTALNLQQAEGVVQSVIGSLSKETRFLPVTYTQPLITDSYARSYQVRVEAFLSHPPVVGIGKRVVATSRADFAPMFSPQDQVGKQKAIIVLRVNLTKVEDYVGQIAAQVDRTAQSPRLQFAGGTVTVLQPMVTGKQLDQTAAVQALVGVLQHLTPNARVRFKVNSVPPPVDSSNPASLGITTWLGTGVTAFVGASDTRLTDVQSIAARLNNDVIPGASDVSLNYLVGTDWPARVYDDGETEVAGQLVPSDGGAMQQVATTFLRALYAAGLRVLERHGHVYLLPWYSRPVGLDAIVSPSGDDLRLRNNTGGPLLIQTRVEPIRQELYIYVYGRHLGWQVKVDNLGKILKVYPHGSTIVKQDPSLPPGTVHHVYWPHDGADTVVQRVITKPSGKVVTDQISTHYQPWRGVIVMGVAKATPTPTTGSHKKRASLTPGPGATPTPTFSH